MSYSPGTPITGAPAVGSSPIGTSTTAASWGSLTNVHWLNVKDYGAVMDGTTDDTTAIQNALNAAASSGAGAAAQTVYIPAGFTVMGPVTIGHGVTLRGAGMRSTTILAKAGTANNSYLISNSATARMMTVSDLRLLGNATNQTHTVNGLEFNATGTGIEYVDMRATGQRIHIEDFTGDAFTMTGRGVNMLSECAAFNCTGNGFISDIDNYITSCDAGSCLNGFKITANTQVSNCKGWFSGWRNGAATAGVVAAGNGNGFLITAGSGNTITSIYAQDNAGPGIYLDNCSRVTISPWIADSNNNFTSGTSPNVEINNSYNCNITQGYNFDRQPGNLARPASGLTVVGGSSFNTVGFLTDGLTNKVGTIATYQNVLQIDMSGGASVGQNYASSFTPDNTLGSIIDVGVLTGNMTVNAPKLSANSGSTFTLLFTQDATGSRTLTWNAAYRAFSWQPTATANSHSNVTFTWNGNAGIWEKIGSQN